MLHLSPRNSLRQVLVSRLYKITIHNVSSAYARGEQMMCSGFDHDFGCVWWSSYPSFRCNLKVLDKSQIWEIVSKKNCGRNDQNCGEVLIGNYKLVRESYTVLLCGAKSSSEVVHMAGYIYEFVYHEPHMNTTTTSEWRMIQYRTNNILRSLPNWASTNQSVQLTADVPKIFFTVQCGWHKAKGDDIYSNSIYFVS